MQISIERKRENFLRLCRSCHRRYDLTEEKSKKAQENLWWVRGIKRPGVSNFKKGNQLWKLRKNNEI